MRPLIVVLLVSMLFGCATSRKQGESSPYIDISDGPESTTEEQKTQPDDLAFQGIQGVFESEDYHEVISLVTKFKKRFSNSSHMPEAFQLKGMAYLLTNRPRYAIPQFLAAISRTKDAQFRLYLRYNLAAARYEAKQYRLAWKTLENLNPNDFDPLNRIKVYQLRARYNEKNGKIRQAIDDLMHASFHVTSRTSHLHLNRQLEQDLLKLDDRGEAQIFYEKYSDSPLADIVLFSLIRHELSQNQITLAEKNLEALLHGFPGSPHRDEASQLLDSIQETKLRVNPMAIGILLPVRGRFSEFGRKALQAIELAFEVLNERSPYRQYQLIVEDSGDNAEQAIAALDTLFFKHNVIAVIGPLLSKGIDEITERAQELGLPLFSLAQYDGQVGGNVVQAGINPQIQARTIAKYAVEDLGFKKFAVLFPQDRFGKSYSNAFWKAIEDLGGSVTSAETYAPGEVDFRAPVDKLAGLHYQQARQAEIDDLEGIRQEMGITKRTRKTEQYYNLRPKTDFEAVFIPDEPRVAGQILPAFSFRDIDHVTFLGTSAWNTPELVRRAERYAEGATFVDAFYENPTDGNARSFIQNYSNTFDETPGRIEATAFDAAKILAELLVSSSNKTRDDVRSHFTNIKNHRGVTGEISWEDGYLHRQLHLFSVKNGSIVHLAHSSDEH